MADDPCGQTHLHNPGPDIHRGCTDSVWAALFAAYACGLLVLLGVLNNFSNANSLYHGKDHYRNFCGLDGFEDRPYVFYPDLQTDFLQKTHYGICVAKCPALGDMIHDYEGVGGAPRRRPDRPDYFVALPSFSIVGRCIPFEPPDKFFNGTKLCASPSCSSTEPQLGQPLQPTQVCGLEADGTNRYWLLSVPDASLEQGWRAEGISDVEIDARTRQAEENQRAYREGSLACEYTVTRDLRVRMDPLDDQILVKTAARYTSLTYRWGTAVFKNRRLVLSLGILGALAASFVVVCVFTCCVRLVLLTLMCCFFAVLGAADYVLLCQAGIVTGRTGRSIMHHIANATDADVSAESEQWLHQISDDPNTVQLYRWGAIGLSVLILLFVCVAYASRRNFDMLVGLLREATYTVREMPSLLVFPFGLVVSMVLAGVVLMYMLLCIATLEQSEVMNSLNLESEEAFEQTKEVLAWAVVLGFLWIYFFHVAVFISIIAAAVSNWYFYRDDPERGGGGGLHSEGWYPGKPVLLATYRICRFHLGSLALGSFVMALVTLPRIILEYLNRHAGAEEQNEVVKVAVRATRCCLWCFERFMAFITEYAYVYVAAIGKPFCKSAQASFILFAKYPVQVALDKMASAALGYLVCITVPGIMLVASWFVIDGDDDWTACAVFIAALSYATTRLTVGVYDVCVTTLFVCAMRDTEHYGGRYLPEGLRDACGLQGRAPLRASVQSARSSRWSRGLEMGSFD